MRLRKIVLALQEEGTGQLQAYPHQARPTHQKRPEGRDRLGQQRLALRLRQIRFLRRAHRREAQLEHRRRIHRAPFGQGAETLQRVLEPAIADKFLGLGRIGAGWRRIRSCPGWYGTCQRRSQRQRTEYR